MRTQGVVLQHGAVPLFGDIARICLFLASHPDQERVRARATTVEEALGRPVTWRETADAVARGFAEALALNFVPGTLSESERDWVAALRAEKYQLEEWTDRT
jgi:lipoate-protein ligase A